MATEFGRILKGLIGNCDISQGKLAEELGVSPAILSNYIAGKNIPKMDFLRKCVNYFKLEGNDLKTFFTSAFICSYQNNQEIYLDTRYFKEERIIPLINVVVALLLYNGNVLLQPDILYQPNIMKLIDHIEKSFMNAGKNEFIDLFQPPRPEE